MTTQPQSPDLAQQALVLLETIFDEMAARAVERHTPPAQTAPLWIDANEASRLLGANYTPRRVKELGHMKQVVMDKLDPGSKTSPWIFERQSIINYSARRVFEIDQGK